MKTKLVKKAIIVLTCATLVLSVFAISPDATMAKAKKASYTLIKSQQTYWYDSSKKKWEKAGHINLKYNKKKDPVKIVSDFLGDKEIEKMKWTYKKGKRSKMIVDRGKEYDKEHYKYKKSRRVSGVWKYGKEISEIDKYYYNKKGNLNKIVCDGYDEKYKISYKLSYYKKGGLKKAKFEFYPFKATYSYNKKGLITRYTLSRNNTKVKISYKYDKKGRVKQATSFLKFTGQKKYVKDCKVKVTYTKKKIGKKRYAKMVNSIVWKITSSRYAPLKDYFDFWY